MKQESLKKEHALSVRYKENPFLEKMVVKAKSKQVSVSAMGRDDNILVNQTTGEVLGTHVVTYKKVDEAEFVKLFAANIALTFDLKSAGIKAFTVLIWAVQYKAIGKDIVALDSFTFDEFIEANEGQLTLSLATFKRGIVELEKAKIIAKTMRKGFYFINPNFVFNGNRIAFTTAIEKREKNNGIERND